MLLFLCIILCTCKVLSDSGGMFWRGTQDISEKSFFLSSTLQSLYAESQVQCAMGAMNIFWSRMFCYKNGVCNVSNLDIPPIPNNSSGSPVCFTSSSEFGKCSSDTGTVIENGSGTSSGVPNCQMKLCFDGVLGPGTTSYTFASPIPSGYTYVPGLGCISYALSMLSYSDHRTNCISEGGDLLDVDPSPTVGLLFLDFFHEINVDGGAYTGVRRATVAGPYTQTLSPDLNNHLDIGPWAANQPSAGYESSPDICVYFSFYGEGFYTTPCGGNDFTGICEIQRLS